MRVSKWLRPFGLAKKEFLIFIAVFSIIKCVLLYWIGEMVISPNRVIGYLPDSQMYETLARNIISGHGFSDEPQAPFRPTMFKEPVYAFFIALIYLLFGYSASHIIIVQMLLNPLIAMMIYLIGRRLFDEKIARLASLLVFFTPVFGEISFFIQAEALYLPLFLLFIYTMISSFERNRLPHFVLFGGVLGVCSLCRSIMVYFFVVIVILIAAGYTQGLCFDINVSLKRRLFKILAFSFSFLLVVMPWIARNNKEFKSYQITNKGGEAMWVQATKAVDFSSEELKAHFLYLVSGRLAQKKFPHIIGEDFGDFEYSFLRKTPARQLREKGLNEGQIDKVLAKEAVAKVFSHPFRFSIFSAINYLQAFKYFVPWSILFFDGDNKILSGFLFPAVRFISGLPLGILFSAMAALGVYFSRKKIIRYLLVIAPIGYYQFILFFIAATPGGIQRFVLPVIPLYYFFVSITILKFSKSGNKTAISRI